MKYPNNISTEITQEEITSIVSSLESINSSLKGLVSLSEEEKGSLVHADHNTIPFVLKALEMAERYPQILPENIELEEIRKDVSLIKSIEKLMVPLKNLIKKLEDSSILASSEAYLPSLSIYNAIARASRDGKVLHDAPQRISVRKPSTAKKELHEMQE